MKSSLIHCSIIALLHYLIVALFSFIVFASPIKASETTVYLGSMEKIIETGEVKVYVPAGNVTVMKVPLQGKQNQVRYIYSDHLGSTALTTDELGNKQESYLYYPYGQITNQIPNSNPPAGGQTDKLYTGQRKDESSDLYFYNARYYNPTIGNFISADKAQGPNRYSYVGNNPINNSDPTGNLCVFGMGDCFSYDKELYKKMGYSSVSPVGGHDAKFNILNSDELNDINYALTFFPKEKVQGEMISELYKRPKGQESRGLAATYSTINNVIYLNLNKKSLLSEFNTFRSESSQGRVGGVIHEITHKLQFESFNSYQFNTEDVGMKTIKVAVSGIEDNSEYSFNSFAKLALNSGVSYKKMVDSLNPLSIENMINNSLILSRSLIGVTRDYGESDLFELGATLSEAYSNNNPDHSAANFKKQWPEMYDFIGNAYFGGKEYLNK